MTPGGLLDYSWMGTCHQNDQAMIRRLEFSAPPNPPVWGEGLELDLIIDHACVRKPPIGQGSERFQVSEHFHTGRVIHLKSIKTEVQ